MPSDTLTYGVAQKRQKFNIAVRNIH